MSKGLARRWLQEAVGDTEVDFRPGQWEAIDAVVNRRQSLLVVEKTGWGKSIVYFLSARLLRQQRPDALTIVVSPLISLMRNQIEQAQRIEVNAVSINASNTDNWEQHFEVRKRCFQFRLSFRHNNNIKILCTDAHSTEIRSTGNQP